MNNPKQEVKEGRTTDLYFGKKLEREYKPSLVRLFDVFVVPAIMYGFGDVCQPRKDSVALLESYVIEYIVDLVEKCSEVAHERKRERPDVNDLKFVIRKDKKKLNRVHYLLRMKRIIDRSRFAIDRNMLPLK